ncbi:capsular biosynthesis protein [Cellulomonas sp. zg-ZUI199]|uniref:Capsular biosynthesis protein n=1 Tax=Cellulomonas wangleii TaxID=2816956 RepID=A0ABX8DBD9_9CELL|nr:polysaccharide biosynthesis tyrosine autokinase [Cellulomonas wangleii]MBO0925899.1 capsular biosynthesis protein [Cellulomonas wangleii]QVI63207.1 capsular biosynthesis protein [Cellulomonas wangleii]
MTVQEYTGALARHWVVIVLTALAGGVVGYLYAASQPAQYRSTASVMLAAQQGESPVDLLQGATYVQNLMASYTVLASSPLVLEHAIEDLGLATTPSDLARQVRVDSPLDTSVIEISVAQPSPQEARAVADAVAASLADAVPQVSPRGAQEASAVRVTVIAPATAAQAPVAPNTRFLVASGLLLGALLGCAYAVLRRVLDTRPASAEEAARAADAPVLAELPATPPGVGPAAEMTADPAGAQAEAFRSLLATLLPGDAAQPRQVLLVASGDAEEGRSAVALGLAVALAGLGRRVLLVDADLRHPTVARATGLPPAPGLTDVLAGDASAAVGRPWGPDRLTVLTSGPLPSDPGPLLASDALAAVLRDARAAYDHVVLDSPPALALSDALWLASRADGVLVVVRPGTTRGRRLRRTVARLRLAGGHVLGLVLGGAPLRTRARYAERLRPPSPRRPAAVPGPAEPVPVPVPAGAARGVGEPSPTPAARAGGDEGAA